MRGRSNGGDEEEGFLGTERTKELPQGGQDGQDGNLLGK